MTDILNIPGDQQVAGLLMKMIVSLVFGELQLQLVVGECGDPEIDHVFLSQILYSGVSLSNCDTLTDTVNLGHIQYSNIS